MISTATMSFTDDDLKRLKFELENHAPNWMDKDNLAGLLARLEAAEKVIEAQGHTEQCADEFMKNGCICHFQPAIDLWLRAAGK